MKKYKLGEIAEIIGGVTYAPSDICEKGIRILRGGNIQSHGIVFKDDDIFLPYYYASDTNQLQTGDTILVASTGSVEALGRVATCFSDSPNTQIGAFLRIIRPKRECYAMLISMVLNSSHFEKYIKMRTKGTNINNITLTHLTGYEFSCPINFPPISKLYLSIEKKIALNRAINHNLEAMAKQLYDYWFVQFDFPDENGRPYKSSGGKMVWNEKLKRNIPEDWSAKHLNQIENNIITGKTPSTSIKGNFQGDIPFITIDDIRQELFIFNTSRTLTAKGANSQVRKTLPKGSLCCSCIGTPGILGFVGIAGQTNQQINSIIFHNVHNREFLYFSLDLYFQFASAKIGNILPNMSKMEFSKILLPYPSNRLVERYHTIVNPIFQKIRTNTKELLELTKLRDELLPLLMNGQVSVNYDLSND